MRRMAQWTKLVFLAQCVVLLAAEICQEGRQEHIAGDCYKFKSCLDGRWVEMQCSAPFHVYDPKLEKCVDNKFLQCKQASAECSPEGTTRPNRECTRYDACIKGSWSTYQCPNDYAYDTLTSTCVKKQEATCYGCDEFHPDPDNCKNYYTCEGAKREKVSCGLFQNFDSVTRKCVWFGAHCQPIGACTEEHKKIPAENCRQYEECLSGRFYKRSCGFSQIYDSVKEKCVWVWPWEHCEINLNTECTTGQTKILGCKIYSKCISGSWHQGECKEGQTVKEGKCVEESCVYSAKSCDEYTVNGEKVKCEKGYYFDEILSRCTPGLSDRKKNFACKNGEASRVNGTCKNYVVCEDGKLVKYECDQCQNFDDQAKKCMFVWESTCPDSPTTTTTTGPTDTTATEPTDTTATEPTDTTATTEPSPIKCKDGERKPDPKTCHKYYECLKGNWKHKSCAWYFFFDFDKKTMKCKFWNAECA